MVWPTLPGSAVLAEAAWSGAAYASSAPVPLSVPADFGTRYEMAEPTVPVQWSEFWARPGDEEIRMGAIMMPFGAISCGLMLIIGLIVLIAGHVQNGDWDGTPMVEP